MTLRNKIEQEIREHGPMRFSRYMEMCLYDPEFGYYSREPEKFGKSGDFYTSSDVHAVFGRLLARQFEEIWRIMGSPATVEVRELGPGRGLFAQDVLEWSARKFPEFFVAMHYALFERSPALRAKIQSTLAPHLETGKASLQKERRASSPVTERNTSHESPLILFANEFFDAFPVEMVSDRGSLWIVFENGRLRETWAQPSEAELEFLDRYGVHPEPGERIEVPLAAMRYMNQLAAAVEKAVFVIVDYGYTRSEQLSGRHRGTLMTFRRHSAATDPYEAPGDQDITAHVNFTALAAAAEQNGMQVQPLVTQSQFLLGIGESTQFADVFEDTRLPQERAKRALQLKHLINPEGMGETFRVLVASRGIDPAKFARLSGLSFSKAQR
ncbi:MAG TPA: SAM-dependent methyltransferase [Terriglobales bacterium]|nr:SAM-dependent methyltransferase [Terriglobales bacterium]